MNEYINHEQAIKKIANKFDLKKEVISSIVESFIVKIEWAINMNVTVEIRGFGTFKPNIKGRLLLKRRKQKEKAIFKTNSIRKIKANRLKNVK